MRNLIRSSWVWALAALVIAFVSLGMGAFHIDAAAVAHSLFTHDTTSVAGRILWDVRLPRVVMALAAGGALALTGAALQGIFCNPLVDPHIIGVTAGASFGGTLAILLGFSTAALMGSAFCFGLLALLAVWSVAQMLGRASRLLLILAGVILAGFFSALVSLLQYLADTEEVLPSIVFWLMGSFATANWNKAAWLIVPVLIAGLVLMRLRWRINLLSLEDADAAALGVPVKPLRALVLVLCAVLTSSQVAVSGGIGWVGLVVPHIARLLVGADNRKVLPVSFWLGAGFLVLIDDAARTLTSAEIPLGILTAIFGAPIFAFLLWRNRRSLS